MEFVQLKSKGRVPPLTNAVAVPLSNKQVSSVESTFNDNGFDGCVINIELDTTLQLLLSVTVTM